MGLGDGKVFGEGFRSHLINACRRQQPEKNPQMTQMTQILSGFPSA
jgi:hypothetical protein